MTLSLAAVFIPVSSWAAYSVVSYMNLPFDRHSVLVSGFVSLTLTPMLCSRFLQRNNKEGRSKLYQLSERFFDGMRAAMK